MTWTLEEKKEIFEAYSVQVDGANKYGEKPNIRANLRVLEAMFSDRFTGEQMVKTIYNHMLQTTEIIKPAHIEAILNPAKPTISQAQYIQACKENERDIKNGVSEFMCPNKELIRRFTLQEMGTEVYIPELKGLPTSVTTLLPENKNHKPEDTGDFSKENRIDSQMQEIDKRKYVELSQHEQDDLIRQILLYVKKENSFKVKLERDI